MKLNIPKGFKLNSYDVNITHNLSNIKKGAQSNLRANLGLKKRLRIILKKTVNLAKKGGWDWGPEAGPW